MVGRSDNPKVLILGGGFGGLSCALALSPHRFNVTVLDRKQHFEFLPAIHELVSQRKTAASLRLPLKTVLAANGHRFTRATVQRIDPETQQVITNSDLMDYDYLVLALGGIDTDFGIDGVAKHSMGFKSVAQCAEIGKTLGLLVRSKKRASVSIIGMGFEGIEAAGEVLRYTDHHHATERVSLNLIDAADRLLPGAPEAVSEHLASLSRTAGAHLYLDTRVSRVMPKTIEFSDGERVRSDLTIWTAGAVPQPLLHDSGLSPDIGWVATQPDLRHPHHDNVFVIGDNAETHKRLSKQAYHAMDMGSHCAANLKRLHTGRGLRDFRASDKPQLISFGAIDTVLLHPTVCLSGPALAPLKEAIYQLVLAQLDQRRTPKRLAGVALRGMTVPRALRDIMSRRAGALRSGVKRLA